jgi:hypothetical protein
MVPESYAIGLDQMKDDEHKHAQPDLRLWWMVTGRAASDSAVQE